MPTVLLTFGSGACGELGHGRADEARRTEARAVEFPVPGQHGAECVALGTDHSLAVVGGSAYRWGLLGAHTVPRAWRSGPPDAHREAPEVVPSPAAIAGGAGGEPGGVGPFDVQAVACGGSNSYMLSADGEVFLLGGLWPPGGDPWSVRRLWGAAAGGPPSRVARVAAGWRHCLLLTEVGRVFALGDDEHGQCGGNSTGGAALAFPTRDAIVGIAAGACHSAAVDAAGRVFAWGCGGNGRLGLGGGPAHCRSPAPVDLGGEPACDVGCGANFTLFVTRGGAALWGCGSNRCGQLGLGAADRAAHEAPERLDFPRRGDEIVGLACGSNHALCLTRGASTAQPRRPNDHDAGRPVVWAWGS
ncbi:unnamed protein product, partial [Prorocentrum cordatum]